MANALSGFRVLEVAAWTFVPAAGAVLADWGADVIKVEHPETGDPQRGLVSMGLIPGGPGAVNYIIEQPNRGKRSIGIDISTDGGRDLLYKLAETSDVFLTSFLPGSAPAAARSTSSTSGRSTPTSSTPGASGQGPLGPDREKGGYDGCVLLGPGRGGQRPHPGRQRVPDRRPAGLRRPGRGHGHRRRHRRRAAAAGHHRRGAGRRRLAAGPGHVAAVTRHRGLRALRRRPDAEIQPELVAQPAGGQLPDQRRPLHHPHDAAVGPLLARLLRAHRPARPHRGPALRRRRRPLHQRQGVRGRCIDEVFASKTFAEWKEALATLSGVWAPGQMASELVDDPQVGANGYLSRVDRADGKSYDLVANPVQMDETADQLTAGPRARPAHRGDPPRAGPGLGPDHRPQGGRRHHLSRAIRSGSTAARRTATWAGSGGPRPGGCSPR